MPSGLALDAGGADGAGAALCLERGADVIDGHVAGTGGGVDVGGTGKGDVVVDGDVAEEVVVVGFADDDVVAVLGDGRVVNDLLDAGIGVAVHPAVIGVDVADDVNLIVGAWLEADVSGAGGDRYVWRA